MLLIIPFLYSTYFFEELKLCVFVFKALCVFVFSPSDCSVKFTDAFHREQEHDLAGFGVPDPTAGMVWVRFRAVVSERVGLMVMWLYRRDFWDVILSVFFFFFYIVLLCLVRMMWAAGAVAAMSSITFPAVSALVSRTADPDQQGETLALRFISMAKWQYIL